MRPTYISAGRLDSWHNDIFISAQTWGLLLNHHCTKKNSKCPEQYHLKKWLITVKCQGENGKSAHINKYQKCSLYKEFLFHHWTYNSTISMGVSSFDMFSFPQILNSTSSVEAWTRSRQNHGGRLNWQQVLSGLHPSPSHSGSIVWNTPDLKVDVPLSQK